MAHNFIKEKDKYFKFILILLKFGSEMGRLQKKQTVSQKLKKKQKTMTQLASTDKSNSSVAKTNAASDFNKKTSSDTSKKIPSSKSVLKKTEDTFISNSIQFFREVKIELKKVVWPTQKQTVGSTIVVIVLVFIVSFFLGISDWGLSSLVQVVLK